jgi:ABC-type sugar transport system ATPase subunit
VSGAPLIEIRGVRKRFGGIQALRDVSLSIGKGAVHGLVGENGAGKSTLGKLLAGVYRPDAGEIRVAGRTVHYHSPRDALSDGVTLIAQELVLMPDRSVLENVFLGIETSRAGVVDGRALRRRYHELDALGLGLDPDALVGALRLADQQKVEIMRSLARNARVIVMDEPTASLSPFEAGRLFEIVRQLADSGTTVVFISHFLEDVLALCDTVTVLRDGAVVRTAPSARETPESLVTAMIGRSLETTFPERRPPPPDAPVVLSVRGLSARGRFQDVSFDVRRGEIVGLAGLVGSGRTEVARAIFGADPLSAGEIKVDGRSVSIRSPSGAVRAGIALLPEARAQGLVLGRSIAENVSLPHLGRLSTASVVRRGRERRAVVRALELVGRAGADLLAPVGGLSGGNQQRVLFAKWLLEPPKVLIADEPTRGVDVGAKAAIYGLLARLAADGLAIVLISSEHEEVLGLAHRTLLMRNGRIAGELSYEEASAAAILALAFGTAGREVA